jgi:PAS domain S-box-containing protein
MAEWLLPSLIATLTSTLVLSSVYFYLYVCDRHRYLLIWSCGWVLYALRFALMLVLVAAPAPAFAKLLSAGNQLAALLSGVMLLWGTYRFRQKTIPAIWFLLLALVSIWIVVGSFTDAGFLALTLPNYLFLGVVYVQTGIVVVKMHKGRGLGVVLTGVAFVIWGLHKADYPFLRQVDWFAPWGYLIGATLQICVAIGIVMIYFQTTRDALASSEERLDFAIRGSQDGLWDREDMSSDRYWWSPRIYELLGYKPGQIEPSKSVWKDLMHPDDIPGIREALGAHLKRRVPYDVEFRMRRTDNEYRWFRVRGRALWDSSGRPERMSGSVQDIHDLKSAVTAADMAHFSIENTTMEIYWINENSEFAYVNDFACQALGYTREELYSLTVPDMSPDLPLEEWTDHWQALKAKGSSFIETRHRRKDGSVYPVAVTANYQEYEGTGYNFAFAIDMSDRHRAEKEKARLESQVAQAQKMEAIGTLAGGIAHDFNNILSAIIGYADMALQEVGHETSAGNQIQEVLNAGARAKDLVGQILMYGRKSDQGRIPVNLNDIIDETVRMLRSMLPSHVEIVVRVGSARYSALANPTQVQQVLINLCSNASHAMEKAGGVLTVSCLTVPEAPRHLNAPEGPFTRITVADTGEGIEPEILERIFDPYFSTKEVGKGSGIGLAVVLGIVESHGGYIEVLSNVGVGTAFHVHLPQIESSEAPRAPSRAEPPGGSERILFVDDEKSIVDIARRRLSTLGYIVSGFTDSLDALESFQNDPASYDLVVTDQTMPGLTGEHLASRIMEIRPEIPVILCTGYSVDVDPAKAEALGITAFVMKPAPFTALADEIRSALDSNGGSD